MIEEMLKNNEKLAARKQLYYSLACLYLGHVERLKFFLESNPDLGDSEGKSREEMRDILARGTELMLPLYRFSIAMRSYKQAFGEYPEMAKFLNQMLAPQHKGQLEDVLQNAISSITLLESSACKVDPTNKRPIHKIAFGDAFLNACNEVKLKGEH